MPERVLILRLSSLGDVILSLSVLNDSPESSEFDFLTSSEYESLVKGHPKLRKAFFFNRGAGLRSWLQLVYQLTENKYSLVIDLHSTLRTRILQLGFLFINLNRRQKTRFVRTKRYRFRRFLFLTLKGLTPRFFRPVQRLEEIRRLKMRECWFAKAPPAVLPADLRYLVECINEGDHDLGSAVNPPMTQASNEVHTEEHASTEEKAPTTTRSYKQLLSTDRAVKGEQRRRIGLVPSASWRAKEWGTKKFFKFALTLGRSGRIPVIFGTPRDLSARQLVQALREIPGFEFEDATDSYDFKITARRITECEFVVSGDTGLAHLSESLGVSVFTIFGPTHPDLGFAPKLPKSRTIISPLWCSPCSKDGSTCFRPIRRFLCMEQVDLELDEGGMPRRADPNIGA